MHDHPARYEKSLRLAPPDLPGDERHLAQLPQWVNTLLNPLLPRATCPGVELHQPMAHPMSHTLGHNGGTQRRTGSNKRKGGTR